MHWGIYVLIALVLLLGLIACYLRRILALSGLHRHYSIPGSPC